MACQPYCGSNWNKHQSRRVAAFCGRKQDTATGPDNRPNSMYPAKQIFHQHKVRIAKD
jgi:hypothetical protein